MRRVFLIDASALVHLFIPQLADRGDRCRRALTKLLSMRSEHRAKLYTPNFCMAECSRAFSRFAYKSGSHQDATDRLRRYTDALLEIVSRKRKGLIISLELEREHLVDVEDVFITENILLGRESDGTLSGLDAIILSMARRLQAEYSDEEVIVITADRNMARLCNKSEGAFPRAIDVTIQPIPD